MDKLIVVSADSHAQVPPDAWQEYLEPEYHEHLPRLREENEVYTTVMGLLADRVVVEPESLAVYDTEGAYRAGGFLGVWDADRRVQEMDREGIAGEFVYHGDHRATSLFHNVFNRKYDFDVCEAGVRAYHRWAADTFAAHHDRIFLVGAGGSGIDVAATLAELEWISEHGFVGTFAPGFIAAPGLPPLFDEYWEPVWTLCEERHLPVFVHAGFGSEPGLLFPVVAAIKAELDAGVGRQQVVERVRREVFTGEFFSDVKPRRPMWQLMLGGVFDRHPELELVMTEVRADWLPATLRHLDRVYEQHRDDLPAQHTPTEYWHSNCLTSLSFVHRAEVEMRHELGIETLAFGRDYPHTESTWPNTLAWLRDAFAGVPENEMRLVLGENAIRALGLDRARLAEVAERIGPTVEELTGAAPSIDPALIAHFDLRGGYLKPAEGGSKLSLIDEMLRDDLVQAGVTARVADRLS